MRSCGADARTSRHPGRKLTCTRREAQSPEAQTYLYLSLGGARAHEASGAEQRPWDESQRAPRSDLPSLASDWAPLRCIGTRRSAATEGTSPTARSDLPTHERECAPDAPQVRNGQGRSLPPLFSLSPKTVRGPAVTQGCTHPAPQPHSSTRRGRARRPKNRPGQWTIADEQLMRPRGRKISIRPSGGRGPCP